MTKQEKAQGRKEAMINMAKRKNNTEPEGPRVDVEVLSVKEVSTRLRVLRIVDAAITITLWGVALAGVLTQTYDMAIVALLALIAAQVATFRSAVTAMSMNVAQRTVISEVHSHLMPVLRAVVGSVRVCAGCGDLITLTAEDRWVGANSDGGPSYIHTDGSTHEPADLEVVLGEGE